MVQPWSRPVVQPVCTYRTCYRSRFICLTLSKQSILKEINPEYSLEGLKPKHQYFGQLMQRADSMKKKKKNPDTGKDWGWEEKGTTEDEMDGITDSVDMNWSKLWEKVKDRWPSQAILHDVANNWTRSAKANTAILRSAVEKELIHRSWTIKKAEHWRTDASELWCWRRLLRVPWTARRSSQSILKDISPEYSLEGLMLKLQLQATQVVKDLATEQ